MVTQIALDITGNQNGRRVLHPIAEPTPTNPDKYYVRYWYKAWQDSITGTPKAYVYGIFKQGFDGVVIDGINAYSFFEGAQ